MYGWMVIGIGSVASGCGLVATGYCRLGHARFGWCLTIIRITGTITIIPATGVSAVDPIQKLGVCELSSAGLRPTQGGRKVQIHKDPIGITEVNKDAIVGGHLWERA